MANPNKIYKNIICKLKIQISLLKVLLKKEKRKKAGPWKFFFPLLLQIHMQFWLGGERACVICG